MCVRGGVPVRVRWCSVRVRWCACACKVVWCAHRNFLHSNVSLLLRVQGHDLAMQHTNNTTPTPTHPPTPTHTLTHTNTPSRTNTPTQSHKLTPSLTLSLSHLLSHQGPYPLCARCLSHHLGLTRARRGATATSSS